MLLIHACPKCHGTMSAGYAEDQTVRVTCLLAKCVLKPEEQDIVLTRLQARELEWQFATSELAEGDEPILLAPFRTEIAAV